MLHIVPVESCLRIDKFICLSSKPSALQQRGRHDHFAWPENHSLPK